ncbi:hypothetical protein S245_001544 [Arachis hypogaea]
MLPSTVLEFLQAELKLQRGIACSVTEPHSDPEGDNEENSIGRNLIQELYPCMFINSKWPVQSPIAALSHFLKISIAHNLTQLCHHLDYETDLEDVKYWSWHNEVVGVWVPGCSSTWKGIFGNWEGIGIRSEDLEDSLELLIKGCSMSLSFLRLVIPPAIYGISVLSYQYFTNDFFDFQAAVLVQVNRDNEDLQLVFPENDLLN